MKNELRRIGEIWNNSGEQDGTDFAGRYFIDADYLTEFAEDNGVEITDDVISEIESVCECSLIDDYEGANPNRHFTDYEIIFH